MISGSASAQRLHGIGDDLAMVEGQRGQAVDVDPLSAVRGHAALQGGGEPQGAEIGDGDDALHPDVLGVLKPVHVAWSACAVFRAISLELAHGHPPDAAEGGEDAPRGLVEVLVLIYQGSRQLVIGESVADAAQEEHPQSLPIESRHHAVDRYMVESEWRT